MTEQFSRIAVLGANGQVGSALVAQLGGRAIPLTRAEADLGKPETLEAVMDGIRPDAVINAAAYTAVDKAEEERDAAYAANAEGPAALARWCAVHNVPFVHYSTDYVFDGEGETPWCENDPKAPLNVYGASKLAGEVAVEETGVKYLIFRISWVYDAAGKNFMNTMLRLGAEREALNVVADQFGAPCYAPDIAEYTLRALEKAAQMPKFPSGIYHMVHGGVTNWHGFAEAIFSGARQLGRELRVQKVGAIPASSYPTPAKRPQNSRMNCAKFQSVFGLELPDWRQGLRKALEQKQLLEKKDNASHHLPA